VTEDTPLISVIIPTLNRTGMLAQAIQSVVNQTYPNIEIIVVDDFSDEEVEYKWRNSFIPTRLIRNDNRMGGASSRNIGVASSKGEYICFLDDDDTYDESKLSFLYEKIKKNKHLDAVFGKVVGNEKPKKTLLANGCYVNNVEAIGELHTNGSLIKRSTFEQIKFFSKLKKYQDTQLHFELIKIGLIKYYDKPVAFWNKDHGQGQITDLKSPSQFIKGIDAFIQFETYIKNRYRLNFFEQWFFIKRKIYLVYHAETSSQLPYKSYLTIFEQLIYSCAKPYVYLKK